MKSNNKKRNRRDTGDARRNDLAIIHIAKKQLGLDDGVYREVLFNMFGVNSAADLTTGQRRLLIDDFRASGFKPVHKSAKKSGMHVPAPKDREPQLSKIGALLADAGLPWSYADGIARNSYGVDRVRWLHPDQLSGVIAALLRNRKVKKK